MPVDLDGGDPGPRFGQRQGERAEPCTDLDHRLPGLEPASRTIRRTVLASATKFCPSARLGRRSLSSRSWLISAGLWVMRAPSETSEGKHGPCGSGRRLSHHLGRQALDLGNRRPDQGHPRRLVERCPGGERARGTGVSVSTSSRSIGQSTAASRTSAAFLKVTTPLKESDAPRSRHRRASSGPPVKQWRWCARGPRRRPGCRWCRPRPRGCGRPGPGRGGGPARPGGECLPLHGPGANGRSGSRARTRRSATTSRVRPLAGVRIRSSASSSAVDGVDAVRRRRGGGGRWWPRLDPLGERPRVGIGAARGPGPRPRPTIAAPVPTQTIRVTPASAARAMAGQR